MTINKGLKSALVKLASRDAVTRSHILAAMEEIQSIFAQVEELKNIAKNTKATGLEVHNMKESNAFTHCNIPVVFSAKRKLRSNEIVSLDRNGSQSSKKEKQNCSVTLENENKFCKGSVDDRNIPVNLKGENTNKETTKQPNERPFSNGELHAVKIIHSLQALLEQRNLSSDELCDRLYTILTDAQSLLTKSSLIVASKFIFNLGRCFNALETNPVFRLLPEKHRRFYETLIDNLITFTHSVTVAPTVYETSTGEEKHNQASPNTALPSLSGETCSPSDFEAFCAEKQNDYPLQMIFDNIEGPMFPNYPLQMIFDNIEGPMFPNKRESSTIPIIKKENEQLNRRMLIKELPKDMAYGQYLEVNSHNLNNLALDNSTDLEWMECFRSMYQNSHG
eukprot:jgi/Galph1/1783/GphlegSOOS_G444.1